MNTNQNEEQLLDRFNYKQKKITQNRLVLTTTLNFITLAITIFSMTYYQWASITVTLQQNSTISTSQQILTINQQRQVSIWLNLLYMKQKNQQNYQTYSSASDQFCSQNDLFCLTFFYELAFVGGLSFFILACGFMIQMFQVLQLTYFLIKTKLFQNQNFLKTDQFKLEYQNDFRHILSISTYSIAISLDGFGLKLIDSSITFGLCFWLFMSTLLLFILVIIYTRIQMSKIQKQNMILKLINQQKHIHNEEWQQRKRLQSIELSSDSRKSETQFGI